MFHMLEFSPEVEEHHEHQKGGRCPEHELEHCPQKLDARVKAGCAGLNLQGERWGEHFFQHEMDQFVTLLRYLLVSKV